MLHYAPENEFIGRKGVTHAFKDSYMDCIDGRRTNPGFIRSARCQSGE